MKHDESNMQIRCVKWFRYNYPSRTIFSIPMGGFRNVITGAIMKAEGAMAGAADLFVMHAAHGFNGLFIEMKARTGRQSESQKAFEYRCNIEEYQYAICRSFEEFQTVVNEYFKK